MQKGIVLKIHYNRNIDKMVKFWRNIAYLKTPATKLLMSC